MTTAQLGPTRANRRIVASLLLATLLAGAGFWWMTADLSESPVGGSVKDTSVGQVTDAPPVAAVQPESVAAGDVGALGNIYRACVEQAGFEVGPVQVLLWQDDPGRPAGGPTPRVGQPWWVKTGRDVPADIHRPCFTSIGGDDPHMSSYGR